MTGKGKINKKRLERNGIEMKCKRIFIIAGAAASLAVFSPALLPAEYAQEAGIMQCQAKEYKNGDYVLSIPNTYNRELKIQVLKNDPFGKLFTVSEQASIDAANAKNYETDGVGWLFSVGVLSEDKINKMLCGEMSGSEVFAKDNKWNYYVFYHPTDVRYFRESDSAMRSDQKEWSRLTEWVGTSVEQDFIKSNPGLEPVRFDNSTIGMMMARIMFKPGTEYTISTNEFGPIKPNGVNPMPYADTLIKDAKYEMVDIKETPDGQYVVLSFPREGLRLDFFLVPGKENYVREVRKDGGETLYKGTFQDSSIKASDIMYRWYKELASKAGL